MATPKIAQKKTQTSTTQPTSQPKIWTPDMIAKEEAKGNVGGTYNYGNTNVAQTQQYVQPQFQAPTVDYQAMYREQAELAKKAAEQQLAAQLNQLRTGYESTTGRLNQEASALPQQTYQTVQGVKQSTAQQARSLNEALAAKGLQASGSQAQGEIARGVTEQTGIGNALQREAELKADIERRRSEAERAYQSDVASANAGIGSSLSSQLAALNQRYGEMGAEQQYKTALLNYQQSQDQSALERQQREKDLSLFASTVDRYSQDYTAEINRLKAQGVPDSDPRIAILEQARAGKVANIEVAKQKASQLQTEQQAQLYSQALDRAVKFGQVLPQDAALLGIPAGTKTQAAEVADLRAQISAKQYELALTKYQNRNTGSGTDSKYLANISSSNRDSAVVALNVLKELEQKGDLVGVQTFLANNATLIDQYAAGKTGTVADQQAADEIQRRYYGKYR